MKNKLNRTRFGDINLRLIIIALITCFSCNIYSQDITATRIANGEGQYADIHYTSIEVSQIIDFSKLVKVYINKSSVILIEGNPASADEVGDIVFAKLKSNIEQKFGDLNEKTIVNSQTDLKILIRKSVFTNKEDYKVMMERVNESIWKFQQHISTKVYQVAYKSLSKEQQKNINKHVPLNNLLGEDVMF